MKFWKAVTKQAGIPDYRLHDNRHTHASHRVSSCLNLKFVGCPVGDTDLNADLLFGPL